MSRKKMNLCLIVLLIVLYLACLLVSYRSAANYVESDFRHSVKSIKDYFEKNYSQKSNEGEYISLESITYDFYTQTEHKYPWQAAFVNSEYRVKEKTGSILLMYEGSEDLVIHLDDYLTKEQWKKIDELRATVGQINTVQVKELEYYMKKGKAVPVKMTLVNGTKPEKVITLKLSNHPAAKYAYNALYELDKCKNSPDTNLSDKEKNIEQEIIEKRQNELRQDKRYQYMQLYLTDLDDGGEHRNVYQNLYQSLNRSNIRNHIAGKLATDYEYYEDHHYWYTQKLEVNGNVYTMYLAATYEERKEVIESSVFRNSVITQSLLFLILGSLILWLMNFLHIKNRKLEESRQMLTSAVAHELKTPLAVIQNQCECILENIAPEKNMDYTKSVYNETKQMNRLIVSFLQYNRLQKIQHLEKTKCDMKEIIPEELEKYEDLFEAAGIECEVSMEETELINGNKELLALVIDNYLSNAYKYTEGGRTITVKLTKEKKGCRFVVWNEDARLIEDDMTQIWDILSRQDKSRNREKGSTGMGLSICRRILELHGFAYGCGNKDNGAEFWFEAK
ncbi:sensor histidine kinase [Dorea sp.]